METPKIQTLMLDKLVCSMQAIEGTHIIENLFNSLSHKVGVLKRNGVKAWQIVCNMAIAKNIKNKRTTTKNLLLNFFVFSPASEDLLQKGVNVWNEDVLYNYTDVSSMSKSKNGRPFRAAKEIHLVILQALIEVYYQLRSLVMDLSTFIGLFRFLSFNSFHTFIPIFVSYFHAPNKQ